MPGKEKYNQRKNIIKESLQNLNSKSLNLFLQKWCLELSQLAVSH